MNTEKLARPAYPFLALVLTMLACAGPAKQTTSASVLARAPATAPADHGSRVSAEPSGADMAGPGPVHPTDVCYPPRALAHGIEESEDIKTLPTAIIAPPADAHRSPSGMAFLVTRAPSPLPGSDPDRECRWDPTPADHDTVITHYSIWKTTGELMWTTRVRERPQAMVLSMIPSGWREALSDMRVGERRVYWMPQKLAVRTGRVADDEIYVFEMELVEVEKGPVTPPDVAGPPPDATVMPSGLAYKVIEPGTGTTTARPWDQVTMNYVIWSADGAMIENSHVQRRAPSITPYTRSKGWSDALQTMVVGQKNQVWMPDNLRRKKPGAPGGPVVVELEVLEIEPQSDPHPVPRDVAKPPPRARKTAGGVYYRVLKSGRGKKRPTLDDQVEVHYTGWTTDGAIFDSSLVRDKPATFPLRGVIPGWSDVVQVMRIGQRIRAWIPEEMAYKGMEGRPRGMLVFDIELIDIKPGKTSPTR